MVKLKKSICMEKVIMSFNFTSSGLSDMGLVRENNEDAWGEIGEYNFYTLADGMGGHQAGEVAARETISHLLRLVRKGFKSARKKSLSELETLVNKSIIQVNAIVYKMGHSSPDLRGMGTTLAALLFQDSEVIIAHVGDSRIYRLRIDEGGNELVQLTRDHSLFSELVDLGQLSEDQSSEFAYKNIITKAIGTESKISPEVSLVDIQPDDVYLLCTDGLSDLLTPGEIKEALKEKSPPENVVQTLIDLAKERGGHDNITAIVVRVHEK